MTSGGPSERKVPVPIRGHERSWQLLVPVVLIVVVLAALVVVPQVVRRYTDRLTAERTAIAQPAQDLVNTIQLSLAREMGALRGYVLTGNEVYLGRYQAALEEERRSYRDLSPLAEALGPGSEEAHAELGTLAEMWHRRLEEAEVLTGPLGPEEFVERLPVDEALHQDALAAAENLRERTVAEMERIREEIQRVERISLAVTVFLALLAFGAAVSALFLGRRLRTLVVEAERQRAEVERLSENRARLIRGITHDLKNPLGAARGYLQLMRAGIIEDPDKRAESLERSDRVIGQALDIINDLLELSRAEAGELHLARAPTDVSALVRETAGDQQSEAERAGLDLQVEAPPDLPAVETDARRVREIVWNLISNALKYTPRGGTVAVVARLVSGDEGSRSVRRWLAVDVRDTGPGIPPEARERVFDEFARLGEAEDPAEGTGLGLTISRQIARLLGGDIEIDSEVGRGSTFSLRLPVRPPPR